MEVEMTKDEFIEELVDILELEEDNVSFKTEIYLDSMSILAVIAFLHENFKKKVSAEELKNVASIDDIAKLAGKSNID